MLRLAEAAEDDAERVVEGCDASQRRILQQDPCAHEPLHVLLRCRGEDGTVGDGERFWLPGLDELLGVRVAEGRKRARARAGRGERHRRVEEEHEDGKHHGARQLPPGHH